MSNIQGIFGLQSRELVEPQLLDVKLFYDSAELWKTRVKVVALEGRRLKDHLAECRCLKTRKLFKTELDGALAQVQAFRTIYRNVRSEAWRLDAIYRENLKNSKVHLRSRRSA